MHTKSDEQLRAERALGRLNESLRVAYVHGDKEVLYEIAKKGLALVALALEEDEEE